MQLSGNAASHSDIFSDGLSELLLMITLLIKDKKVVVVRKEM
jgi:hypothetical protein